jgi:hypothetical protein
MDELRQVEPTSLERFLRRRYGLQEPAGHEYESIGEGLPVPLCLVVSTGR